MMKWIYAAREVVLVIGLIMLAGIVSYLFFLFT